MPDPVPESRTISKRKTRLSLVWVVPIVAALAGTWVTVARILAEGPKIEITLKTAEGLEAGKTKLRYNGVDVGDVTEVRLTDDHKHVVATAQMATHTEGFLVEDTHFWVVRPRVSGASISGLGTLISGAYIGMEIGESKTSRRKFEALDAPPVVTSDVQGRYFELESGDLGSLETGTPIFFRRLQVGQVVSYELAQDGLSFKIKVFVDAPYDQYVNPNTRFWHASGIDLSLSASGLSVQTQSVLSILVGGVAFETPATGPVLPPAEAEARFTLFDNREKAFRPAARDPQTYVLIFHESLRGLTVGAPVEFRGIPVGEVADYSARVDARTFQFIASVTVRLDPQRFGVGVGDLPPGQDLEVVRRSLIDSLVTHGVRAQLQTGSLITGSRFVSFDFFANPPPARVDWAARPPELPTIPGELQGMETRIANIIKKLDEVPIKGVVDDLRKAITQVDGTLTSARGALDNAGTLVAPGSPLSTQMENTLQELSRAAQALRVLVDYLERHPESLIRGKGDDK
jgi:paraquat-inducible protein B